ncbi:MAG: chemotaxis protein CheW [Betaproteobacteria bacterium]|nr:chemotaxis protein CheW [Betaproteobacteria bacterium]
MQQVVTFLLDETRFGLPLPAVERVLRAVWITPLPQAPSVVLGVFDLEGDAVPAVSLRRRFELAERPVEPADQLLVVRAGRRLALHVDAVQGVLECDAQAIVVAGSVVSGIGHVAGTAVLDDGLVLIQDLGTVLSLDEDRELDGALEPSA